MELVVEIITRSEKVLHLVPVKGDTISIGRGYDCDVIIQEEHVCPLHAKISQTESGDLLLTDESEVNGIKDRAQRPLGQKHIFKSGDVFSFGKSFIRIVDVRHPVPVAKKLNPLEEFFTTLNTWYWAVAATLIFTFIQGFKRYQETFQTVTLSKTAVSSVMMALLFVIVPILVAIAARIFKKEVKFFAIVAFFYFYACVIQLVSSLGNVLLFNWGELGVIFWTGEVLFFLLCCLFLWGAFYLASNMSIARISTVSTAFTFTLFGLVYIYDSGDDKVSLNPVISANVLPSSFLFTKPINVDRYIENTGALFDAAVKEAERRNSEANND